MAKKQARAAADLSVHNDAARISEPAPVGALMVCVTGQRSCERLVERGAGIRADNQPFYVVHCVQTGRTFMNFVSDPDAIEYLFSCAALADAELEILREDDVLNALVNFAKAHNVTAIVLGASPKQDGNSFSSRLAERLGNVDFIIVD